MCNIRGRRSDIEQHSRLGLGSIGDCFGLNRRISRSPTMENQRNIEPKQKLRRSTINSQTVTDAGADSLISQLSQIYANICAEK
jgi:hypothetical protein